MACLALLAAASCSARGVQGKGTEATLRTEAPLPAQPAVRLLDAASQTIRSGDSKGADEECFAIGDLLDREACLARMDDQALAECGRFSPFACRPYKEMHAARQRLLALDAEILRLMEGSHASYDPPDGAYVADLMGYWRQASSTWTSHRDAQCQLEPFLDGMDRQEAGDLTEACLLDMTRKRIIELESLAAKLRIKE